VSATRVSPYALGDLTRFIDAYFDTSTGPKRDPESYRAIAARLATAPGEIQFFSDVIEELDAAARAEMQTVVTVRPGNRQPSGSSRDPPRHSELRRNSLTGGKATSDLPSPNTIMSIDNGMIIIYGQLFAPWRPGQHRLAGPGSGSAPVAELVAAPVERSAAEDSGLNTAWRRYDREAEKEHRELQAAPVV
jgi:hypothetical protein